MVGRARVMVEDDIMLMRHDGQYREGTAIVSKMLVVFAKVSRADRDIVQ